MHLFSPWKEEEEFKVISTILLVIGAVAVMFAITAALQSSAHLG